AHDRALGVERVGGQRRTGRLLVRGRHRILEVEDHAVGPRGGLGVAVGPVRRAEQQRRSPHQRVAHRCPASCARWSASLIHMSTCRVATATTTRSEEHTSELQSRENLVCRLLLEKKKKKR